MKLRVSLDNKSDLRFFDIINGDYVDIPIRKVFHDDVIEVCLTNNQSLY